MLFMTRLSQFKVNFCFALKIFECRCLIVEAVTGFIFLGSKTMADCDCSHKIKRHLLLGRKVMTNLDSIFKSRHYFAN